jgi:hypothetical protein
MANVKLNPVFMGFSKSIGDITFFERNGKTFARRRSEPGGIPTTGQKDVRHGFKSAAADWSGLPASIKSVWNKKAHPATGYNAFIAENAPRHRDDRAVTICCGNGLGTPGLLAGTATTAGSLQCQVSLPAHAEPLHLTLFYRPQPQPDMPRQPLAAYHCGENPASPVTISGLEPGTMYEVHAVCSDKALDEATLVSPSISIAIQAAQ